jgi:hypothetical protein
MEIIELNLNNVDSLNLPKYINLLNQLSNSVYSSLTDIKTNLILDNTKITSLPNKLYVGGDLWLENTPLIYSSYEDEIKEMIE